MASDFGAEFGGAVAVSGDTVVVGAIGDDSSATGVNGDEGNGAASDSGAGYVFDVPTIPVARYCVERLEREGLACESLRGYLERHVEVDGGDHGSKAAATTQDGSPRARTVRA